MIQIDTSSEVPAYQQIVDQVRLAVAAGSLRPGDRLEPVRRLAARLGLNASTVARAYLLLERAGVIRTNRRGGSVIAAASQDPELRALHEGRLRAIMERPLIEALALGYRPEEAEAAFELQVAAWRQKRLNMAPVLARAETSDNVLHFSGSHDLALQLLWARARQNTPELDLCVSYVGSLEGLIALWHGDAILAGSHLLDEESGEYNLPILRRLFAGQALSIVTLAERVQGLVLPPGNPRGLLDWHDLGQPGLRLANRQQGSGTRALLDFHLRRQSISPGTIEGYRTVLPTHMAVAAAVAEGRADVGLGLLAAARSHGLDFVPLARERYDLIFRPEDRRRLRDLLSLLGAADFGAVVAALGGYDTSLCGSEMQL